MSKTVNIDVYGKCSKNISLKRDSENEQTELAKYKFYLAFENSKCPEYVTEKLYKIIHRNISDNPPIPVVMGPEKSWYTKNLPKNSFIHVDDYKGPEEMGRQLKYLSSHKNLFFKHLKWRRFHKRVCESPIRCKLCDMLLKNRIKQQTNLIISDFETFWKRSQCYN